MTKLHTLVDLENVHPKIEDLRKLVPRMTDAWVFHGPNQAKKVAVPAKKTVPARKAAGKKAPAKKQVAANKPTIKATTPAKKSAQPAAAAGSESKAYLRVKKALAKMGKEFPHKLKSFQRHVQAMLGKGSTAVEMEAVVQQLERANVVTIAGDLVLYRDGDASTVV